MLTKQFLSFACGALLATCLPAAAQTTASSRPFRGALFNANRVDNAGRKLDISVSLLQAYDDDVLGTTGGSPSALTRPVGGYFSMVQPSVDYQWRGRRIQMGLSEAS